jgi:membrane protease YdiL (CAAX protease family)
VDVASSDPVEPPVVQPPVVLPIERAAAALEVILCSGFPTQIVIITVLVTLGMQPKLADGSFNAPFVFALTLLDTVLLVGLVLFFFRAHRESVREQLFGARRSVREILFGITLIPASFIVVIAVLTLVQLVVPSLRNVPHNPLADLVKSRSDAVIFAFVVMIAGGVREEVQRGFIVHRFEGFLGGGLVGVLVYGLFFGLGHFEQGWDASVITGSLGVFWGLVYLRRRSVIGPMVSHAGFNLAQVIKAVMLR